MLTWGLCAELDPRVGGHILEVYVVHGMLGFQIITALHAQTPIAPHMCNENSMQLQLMT